MDGVNSVRLLGRVAAVGEPRELPSGDVLVTMRVVVPRGGNRRRTGGTSRSGPAAPGVDTIDVACWSAASRRVAGGLSVDEHVEVEGSLRRRFFRGGAGVASRYEVEARRLRRVKVPAETAG